MYQEYRNAQVTEVQRLDARQSRYQLEKVRLMILADMTEVS